MINKLEVMNEISFECIKEIVKSKQITTLKLYNIFPSNEMIMELLKSNTITSLFICRYSDNINKSIVLKDISCNIGYNGSPTVIRRFSCCIKRNSFTIVTLYNRNNWHQKYMIL